MESVLRDISRRGITDTLPRALGGARAARGGEAPGAVMRD